ncbi:MAG: phage tail family protein [Actinobacteria bacterium]|nr:phage tail family protein [Actinomycetota bacterium]MCA1807182.1 phage tail family protein [Actinomycetota bacterium]
MFTSRNPLVVIKNGVTTRLDTLANNVSTKSGLVLLPGLKGSSPEIAGRNGSLYTPGKSRENGRLVISGWAQDSNADGVLGADRYATWRANMDQLLYLFDTQYNQIILREYVTSLSTPSTALPATGYREALVEVTAAIDPEVLGKVFGRFSIECLINEVFWSHPTLSTYTSPTGASAVATHTVTTLSGSTAPILDAIIRVTGSLTNPRVTDPRTGHYIQYNGVLASGAIWTIDCKNFTSMVGAASVTGSTFTAGKMSPYMFGLSPEGVAGTPTIQLSGTSSNTNTKISVEARRKYI